MKKKLREKFLILRNKKYFDLNNKCQKFIIDQIKKICSLHKIKKRSLYYKVSCSIIAIKEHRSMTTAYSP